MAQLKSPCFIMNLTTLLCSTNTWGHWHENMRILSPWCLVQRLTTIILFPRTKQLGGSPRITLWHTKAPQGAKKSADTSPGCCRKKQRNNARFRKTGTFGDSGNRRILPARRRITWSSSVSSEKWGIRLAHSTKVKSCLSAAWHILVTGSFI